MITKYRGCILPHRSFLSALNCQQTKYSNLGDNVPLCLLKSQVIFIYYPIHTTIWSLYTWFSFSTSKCWGCPRQPSSGRARVHKQVKRERPLLSNTGCKVITKKITIIIPKME
jgi:hypothetical protein